MRRRNGAFSTSLSSGSLHTAVPTMIGHPAGNWRAEVLTLLTATLCNLYILDTGHFREHEKIDTYQCIVEAFRIGMEHELPVETNQDGLISAHH